MKRKKGTATLLAAAILTVGLAMSTPALATSSYGTRQWYLNYLQQYSTGRFGLAQPVPAQPPVAPTEPVEPSKPAAPPAGEPTQPQTPPAEQSPQPSNQAPASSGPVYSRPAPGQSTNDWYLNYLRQYQYGGVYTPAPSQPTSPSQPTQPTTPSNPVPNEPVSPPSYDFPSYLTAEEQELLRYLNDERTANGRGVVTVDPELVRIARLRAEKMVELGGIEHNLPDYGTAGKQLTREGYKYAYLGEDLASAGSVYQAHKQLVASSAHREIMLDSRFTKVGIGVAHWKNRPGVVVVEIFVQPY